MNTTTPSANPSVEILIVEDSPTQAQQLRHILEQQGYRVTHTVNGRLALEAAQRHKPAIIISDVVMPEMDGYELCRRVKADASLRDVPVILVTTLSDPADVIHGLECRADNFILKPYDEHYLLGRVQFVLLNREVLQTERATMGVEIFFNGQRHFITADRLQILNLLLSTYDAAIQRTKELMRAQEELVESNRLLGEANLRLKQEIGEREKAEHALRTSEESLQELNKNLERLVTERTGELHESEERFRQLAEQSSEVFWFFGLNPERILYVSPAVETVWGLPAARFYQDVRAWWMAIHAKDQPRVHAAWEAFITGHAPRFDEEFRMVKTDHSIRWVQASGVPIRNQAGEIVRLSGIARDITERRQVHDQMLRAQRLESIGTLAGGVAHDLNNALAPILMGIELLRMQYPGATQMIDTMEASAKRGAEMVRQLLTFAKGVEGARLLLQPQHLLIEMKKIIDGTFPKNIELRVTIPKKIHTILGDATQLHQVLLNLCVNARDAMPKGGRLTLEAENTEIDVTYASTVPDAKPGRYVVWRVTDTGTGIPPEILQRIFEPFFTTKDPDKGTGLGLSTVIGIVKSHGGFVQVYSTLSQGTTFSVYLPAAGESTPPFAAAAAEIGGLRGNGETILVVDDDAAVRQVTRAVLTALNFNVFTAADGTDALIQVAEKRTELRAVITDAHMPHMDGLSFVQVLKRMVPAAGIIVASGRLEEREMNEFKALGVIALLNKPFTQEMLVAVLKTIF